MTGKYHDIKTSSIVLFESNYIGLNGKVQNCANFNLAVELPQAVLVTHFFLYSIVFQCLLRKLHDSYAVSINLFCLIRPYMRKIFQNRSVSLYAYSSLVCKQSEISIPNRQVRRKIQLSLKKGRIE